MRFRKWTWEWMVRASIALGNEWLEQKGDKVTEWDNLSGKVRETDRWVAYMQNEFFQDCFPKSPSTNLMEALTTLPEVSPH